MSGLGYARAIYDFVSQHQEEVSLCAGDVVLVMEEVDSNWLKGKNHKKVGYFPRTYVESIQLPQISRGQQVFLATRPFAGEEVGDLSFDDGDIIVGLEPVDSHWWRATVNGETGIIPLTHVVHLHASDDDGCVCNLWTEAQTSCEDLQPSVVNSGLVGSTVIAHTDLTAQLDYELTFCCGDVIYVLEDLGDGFAIGDCSGAVGQFPLCFCTPTDPQTTTSLPSPERPPSINAVSETSSPSWKKCHSRPSSYTLANTWSQDCSVKPYCSTLYEFMGRAAGELSFGIGEIVHLISHLDDDWCFGELDGKCGAFPTSYVDIIVDCDVTNDDEVQPVSATEAAAAVAMVTEMPCCNEQASCVGDTGELYSRLEASCVGDTRELYGRLEASCVGDTRELYGRLEASCVGDTRELYGRLVCDFVAVNVNEVDGSEGETVTVLQRINQDWLQVRHDNGKVGLCPASFVELFGGEPEPTAKPDVRSSSVVKPKLPVKPKLLNTTRTASSSSANRKSPVTAATQPVRTEPGSNKCVPSVSIVLSSPTTENLKSSYSATTTTQSRPPPPSHGPSLDELIHAQLTSAKSTTTASRRDDKPSSHKITPNFPVGATLNGVADVAGQSTWYMFSETAPVSTVTAPVSTVTVPVSTVTAPVSRMTGPVSTVTAPVSTVTAPRKQPPPPRPAPSRPLQTSATPVSLQNGANVVIVRRPAANLIEFSPDHNPSDASPVSKAQFHEKSRETREKVISELYSTEADYCTCLELCLTMFIASPLPEASGLSAEDMETLFGHVEDVMSLSRRLIDQLKTEAVGKPFDEQVVGKCFVDMKDDIQSVYAQYCRNHDAAIAVLEKYESNDEALNYINEMLSKMRQHMSVFDLGSILIKPVQRILKYPLLLNELIKVTDESHPDKPHLIVAITAMTEVAAAINEFKRRKDLVLKYKKDAKLTDRISRLSVHSTKKKLSRISRKMIGTQLVDERFNVEETKFKMLEGAVKNVVRDISLYLEKLDESLTDFERVAVNVQQFYSDDTSSVDVLCAISSTISSKLLANFKADVETDVIPPLNSLQFMFQGPSNLMRKRYHKLLDYENADNRLGNLKDGDLISTTKEELGRAKAEYEALNAQLLDDLPKLFGLSVDILYNAVHLFLRLQYSFFAHAANQFSAGPLQRMALSASNPSSGIIEAFNIAHASVVDQMSNNSLIPAAFNPQVDEVRRIKQQASPPQQRDLLCDDVGEGSQTEADKARVCGKYTESELYIVSQRVTASQQMDLTLADGCIVAVIKQSDPMGNCDRWFVDNGVTKGFVSRHVLAPRTAAVRCQPDLLSWNDPPPKYTEKPTANQLLSLLDPLSPSSNQLPSHMSTPPPAYTTSSLSRGYHSFSPPTASPQLSTPPTVTSHGRRSLQLTSWETFNDTESYEPTGNATAASPSPSATAAAASANDVKMMTTGAESAVTTDDLCHVLFDFAARDSSEVSLTEGSVVCVLQRSDLEGNTEWWLVLRDDGCRGYAPANYLEPVMTKK